MKEEEIETVFSRNLLAKMFLNLSNIAFDKIEGLLLENLSVYFEKKNFLDLKLEEILANYFSVKVEIIRLLHDRFKRKAWKLILDATILQYFQCMILSCPKSKKD